MGFSDLLGKTLIAIDKVYQDRLVFTTGDGTQYLMHHSQDCCESVTIEEIFGDLEDLIGTPLLMAEESVSREPPDGESWGESETWTFYRLATIKGYVTIRWYGSSNGYYSESVSFEEVGKNFMDY